MARGKGTGHASSRGGGRQTSTPGTSSSRTSAAGRTSPLRETGISGSVSRIGLGSTRADSTPANTTNSIPVNTGDPTPTTDSTTVPNRARARASTGLTELYITDGFLMPPNLVPQACTRSFKKIQNSKGYTWGMTSNETKEKYWEDFKKYFTWDPILESTIHQRWSERAARRYRDFVHDMKLLANAVEDKEAKVKAKPDYITSADWLDWLEYWDREDVKAKAAIAKRCRMSEPEGPGTGRVIHRGGSKSILQFTYELAAKRKCAPRECLFDAYCMSHKNPDGTYTDAKSQRIGEKIQERGEELRRPLPGTTEEREVDWNQAFLDVVPLDSKNRMFGTGELARLMTTEASRFHTEPACGSRLTEVEQQLAEAREERERLANKAEKMEETLLNQQKQIELLLSQSTTSLPSPP